MKVEQIYNLVNSVTSEILGKTDLLKEDLSNIVDLGKELFDNTSVDNYVKSLVNHIGKVIFVNRSYSGNAPKVLMDSWEFGSVLEKVQGEIPEAVENKSWELTDKTDYSPNIFYKPSVSVKFFNSKTTFEVDMSFTELQVKESFDDATQLNAFLSMLYNNVEKSFTIKIDGLIMSTINNYTAQVLSNNFSGVAKGVDGYKDSTSVQAVNLLKLYNDAHTTKLTAKNCLENLDFLKFASKTMSMYIARLSKISTLFNGGKKERFTPRDMLHVILLDEFKSSCDSYLQADTFHNEFTALPNADIIPYWQGSGTKYDFTDTSSIVIKNGTVDVKCSGIIGVMFDRDALGVSNLERRVTTNYNPKAEFYNNFFKMDCGYFNDMNENFVLFFVNDSTGK